MAASSSSKKGKGKPKYPRGVCWNCGEPGHYKDKCPKPATAKSSKDPKKDVVPSKTDSANAVESDSESEAAFSMTYDMDSVESDVFGDADWFDEVAMMDAEELDWFSEEEEVKLMSSVSDNDSLDYFPLSDTSDVVLIATAEVASLDNHCNTQT